MKFKYLIIAFSIIIIIVILVIAFMPALIAEPSIAQNFRYISLPLMIFMVLILAGMSLFFFLNYRLLSLLEREDWPALAYYLEQKVYVKGIYSSRYVRILASSYLVISDYQSVLKLESKAHIAKPSVIAGNVLIFGSARILSGKHEDAAVFFKTHFDKCRKSDKLWVRWYYGFSLLLAGDFRSAEAEFSSLCVSSNDTLITGLSSYFLRYSIEKKSLDAEKCRHTSVSGKERLVKLIKNAAGWKKAADKVQNEVHIAIIRKYLDETVKWLFETA